MRAAGDDARSATSPQNVNHPSDSPGSHFSESPIKRRPGPKAHTGRAQPKKSRKSPASTSRQLLDSVPEHAQPPATLNDLASISAQRQETPAHRNPETPPDCPGSAQERPQVMTEIDIVSDQEQAERGGTAATDLQLESEQRAMQILYDHQKAAGTTREAQVQHRRLCQQFLHVGWPGHVQLWGSFPSVLLELPDGVSFNHAGTNYNLWLRPLQERCATGKRCRSPQCRSTATCPENGRWRGLLSPASKSTAFVRTFLWRRVTEQSLHGSSFIDIPDEINQAYIGDLLLISEAFAAPLSNLFAFARNGHPACPFITQKQLALYANPLVSGNMAS